ncbi:MAG: alpha-mannosidase [Anaerolineaceae bacterium]|nr:alpha-mannosidase [Anaerolineaceae bacterium]
MKHNINWTPQKIESRLQLIQPLEYRKKHPIPPFRFQTLASPDVDPPIATDIDDSNWPIIEPNTYWGTWFTDFIMRSEFDVPEGWGEEGPVVLYLPLGEAGDFSHPEALAYIDGQSYASADRHHHEIQLPSVVNDGKVHKLALHGWTGLGGWTRDPNSKTKLYMKECAVVQVDQPTRDFIARVRMALDVAKLLDDNDFAKGRIFNALDDAFKVLDTRDPIGGDDFYNSVPAALDTLIAGLDEAGEPLDVNIIGVGHAHIDVAWLWQLGHTKRKAGRTFSNVLRLMEQYPEYHFTQSQPQLYKYTEEVYPEIFEGIKERVAEGRWELIGGTWVEPDCNATGPESLARQFLLGRTYFRKHFGDVDTGVLWLPDTFGYSWALPQLIKQAGMDYFITHKMSWNQYNQMPNQLLWWQGIDGTKVLTHFLTTPSGSELLPYSTTYNAVVNAQEVIGTWENFHQKETYNELITAYGYGDGGGGPTREMIENIESLTAMPGAPKVRPGTVKEFLENIEATVADELPTWNGEFYLELHRGTLTSQARNKWNNRKSEFLLHDAELLAAMAAQYAGFEYPTDLFNEAWELVCLNQFHDILPGSSITPVYEDSDRDYAHIRELGESARDNALNALSSIFASETSVLAVNPTTFTGNRVGLLPQAISGGLANEQGEAVLTQAVENGTLVDLPELPAFSVTPLASGTTAPKQSALSVSEKDGIIVVENDLMRVVFEHNADISSIYDKEAGREVLSEGEIGNQLLAMEDRPLAWDAWDVDIFYDDRVEKIEHIQNVSVIENGPIRVTLLVERAYRSSTITQRIYIYHNSKRIDFDTHIDWHESHILLKAAFPVDVLSPTATFDIQWGNVERNTHRNTSWDWGRFETAAQKWADLSEGNYGVALLNDSKYGYDVLHNVMRLSLLKSATMPDPIADQGEHKMVYSLLPHTGDWRNGVPENAYDLNDPVLLVPATEAAGVLPGVQLVSVNKRNAVVETIKQAEDGNGIIVRLYEGERNRGPVTVTAGFDLTAAYHCNLLEETDEELSIDGNTVTLNLKPYEIVTLRLVP